MYCFVPLYQSDSAKRQEVEAGNEESNGAAEGEVDGEDEDDVPEDDDDVDGEDDDEAAEGGEADNWTTTPARHTRGIKPCDSSQWPISDNSEIASRGSQHVAWADTKVCVLAIYIRIGNHQFFGCMFRKTFSQSLFQWS